jgi:hypothetical protein
MRKQARLSSKRSYRTLFWLSGALGFMSLIHPAPALAGPAVTDIRAFRFDDSANGGNFATGDLLQFAADVAPNTSFGFASQCPVGSACPSPTPLTEQALYRGPYTLDSNRFYANTPYNSALTGPWTLSLSPSLSFPPGSTTTVQTPAVGNVAAMPFVPSMTASFTAGGALTPTISWTLPTSSPISIDQVRINVFDVTPGYLKTNTSADPNLPPASSVPSEEGDLIYGTVLPSPTTTSFQINLSNPFSKTGSLPLQYGHTYAIGINLENYRPGTTPIPITPGIPGCFVCIIDSRSQSFFDYTPLPPGYGGLPAGAQIYLPVTQPIVTTSGGFSGPLYSFNVASVSPTSVTFIDPLVATGFIYTDGAGNPNFKSVDPVTNVGNGIYDLSVWNGTSFVLVDSALDAGQTFDFTENGFANGVSEFEITGIDPNAALDPTDITAFVTGLTFVSDGSFTGTMKPIVENVVPEPGTLPLLVVSLGGLILFHRRFRR